MDLVTIAGTLSAAKTGLDILNGLSSIGKSKKVDKEKVIELRNIILDLQEKLTSVNAYALTLQAEKEELKNRIRELKMEAASQKNWSKTKSCYELYEIASGVFVYIEKEHPEAENPSLWYCTHCFMDKKLSIIQKKRSAAWGDTFFCPNCNTEYFIQREIPQRPEPHPSGWT